MAEQQLRQDQYGMYYWADPEPEPGQTEQATHNQLLGIAAEAAGFPTLAPAVSTPLVIPAAEPAAPAKRTRGPRKAAPAPTPAADTVVIPPPPPIIRG